MDKSSSSRIYTPLNPHKREIRLATIKSGTQPEPIRCDLSYVSLNDTPKYEALSYVWGDPSTRIPILLDEHPFGVTQNLGLALRFLRLPTDDRTLWIDAICVNQDDLDERSAQLQLMKNIYHDAHRVVSWLGDKEENTAYVGWLISQAIDQDFSIEWLKTQLIENSAMRKALLNLWVYRDQSYWSRLWITQEIAYAQDGIIQCGDTIIPYWAVQRSVQKFPPNLIHQDEFRHEVLLQHGTQGLKVLSVIFQTIKLNEVATKLVPGMPLLELLLRGRWKLASDPRDKVFGLLGLSDLSSSTHPGLKIDYNRTVRDVYVGVFQAIVDITSKLDILCFSAPVATQWNPEAILGNGQTVLPSWVPDWSTRGPSWASNKIGISGNGAAGDTPASVEFRSDKGILCAAGFFIGTVMKCGASMPVREALTTDEHGLFHAILGDVLEWRKLFLEILGDASDLDSVFLSTITFGAAKATSDFLNTIHAFDTSGGSTHSPSGHSNRPGDISIAAREGMLLRIQELCEDMVFFLIIPSISDPLVTDAAIPLMGAGRSGIRESDMICVFLGCNFPVVIRPDGNHYIFIGAVYVDNLTHGEAIADLENGLYELDCFELR